MLELQPPVTDGAWCEVVRSSPTIFTLVVHPKIFKKTEVRRFTMMINILACSDLSAEMSEHNSDSDLSLV